MSVILLARKLLREASNDPNIRAMPAQLSDAPVVTRNSSVFSSEGPGGPSSPFSATALSARSVFSLSSERSRRRGLGRGGFLRTEKRKLGTLSPSDQCAPKPPTHTKKHFSESTRYLCLGPCFHYRSPMPCRGLYLAL